MPHHYTAADFISAIETSVEEQQILNADRTFLLNNMVNILNKVNEQSRTPEDDITVRSFNREVIVSTSKYVSKYYPNGTLHSESWGVAGELSRSGSSPVFKLNRGDDKPARIIYHINGKVDTESWYQNSKQHRDGDKPAEILYYSNGNIEVEEWDANGIKYRNGDKPATVFYYQSGKLELEEYYEKGFISRADDKPASVGYHENGTVSLLEWFKNGEKHRDGNKPASIAYTRDGHVSVETYWVDGKEII